MSTYPKVLLITGASKGIGKAIALKAAYSGYFIVVNYLTSAAAALDVVRDIESAGGTAVAIQGDVSSHLEVEKIFDETNLKFGPVSHLIANAAFNPGRVRIDEINLEVLEKVIQTNLIGTLYLVRRAIGDMKTHGGGSIIAMSSEAARFGGNNITTYAATKAGINAMVVGLAREVGPLNIRVNAISPGTILTDALEAEGGEQLLKIKNTIPLSRIGEPSEVADAALWLLSDAASYVSGSILTISGGR